MFHEFIDFKKKARISGTNNRKSLRNSTETCTDDQNGSEWPSTIFIPPWLNNIGLKLKNSHSEFAAILDTAKTVSLQYLLYGATENKTEKLHPDLKNPNQNEQNNCEERKQTAQMDDSKKSCYLEDRQKGYIKKRHIQTSESYQKLPSQEKQNLRERNGVTQIPVIWRVKPKVLNMESSSTDSLLKSPTSGRKHLKVSESELSIGPPLENTSENNEQKKKQKILKKKTRMKQQTAPDHETFLKETDVDSLLEEKAKAILENYGKKKIHSTASDIKRFEAKLMMLHTKIKLGTLSTEDSKFLEEVKTRAGSKENFDRLMQHVREVNLKDIIEGRRRLFNSMQTKKDVGETKTNAKEEGGTLLNTDDENEIKRFSEVLRKSQNEEEKRKCLDEIRNYFERKRRTRLTKCWMLNTAPNKYGIKRNGEDTNDNAIGVKWRPKFSINDAELVSKAVDETLKKFVELYDFHVSPSLINCMKNNVLKDIQCHSLKRESSLTNKSGRSCNVEGEKLPTKLQKNATGKDRTGKKSLSIDSRLENLKKTLSESEPEGVGAGALEKEEMKRLKNELEYCINSARKDFTKLKVHSIIFKDDSQNGRNKEFIYGFLRHSLERKKSNLGGNLMMTLKNIHVQVDNTLIAANANTQTQKLVTASEKYMQTENKLQMSVSIQTEGTCAIRLLKLNESDLTAGLYRMVRSEQPGKFYLYPENEEQSDNSPGENKKDNKNHSVLEENFPEKILIRKTEELEPEKNQGICSEVVIDDAIQSINASDKKFFLPEKKECVWLWDGAMVNSGVDLKVRVESLLEEKLKEMSCGFLESLKSRQSRPFFTQNFSKARQSASHDNLELKILHSQLQFGSGDLGLRFQDDVQAFGEESAGTQNMGGPIIATAETKFVKDASTQNSEHRLYRFHEKKEKSSGKSRKSSKTVFLGRRQIKDRKRDRKSRQSVVDLKRAVRMINEYLFEKKMQHSVNDSPKDSTCYSESTPDSSTSLYSKDTNDGRLTLVFGMEDDLSYKNVKHKNAVNEDEKSISENSVNVKNVTETLEPYQIIEKQVHWDLIDKILHSVNHKEREGLWNDLRELIKSKIGKDIDSEDPQEVCIQIEQKGKTQHSVLAKGFYTKKEGNVEIEIDLTLSDLESIIRRRERSQRKRSLNYKKGNSHLRLSSPGRTKSNVSSIQEFRNILRNVSRSRPNSLPESVRVIRMNKEN